MTPRLLFGVASPLAVLVAGLSFLYHRHAPDPARGVGFFYSTDPESDLVYLDSIITAPAADSSDAAVDGELSSLQSVLARSNFASLPLPTGGAPLAVIVHGYTEHANAAWVRKLTKSFLRRHPGSVVLAVDYYHLTTISRPAMNDYIKRVARVLASVFDHLAMHRGLSLSRVHVLCFSLGGRVVGTMSPLMNTPQKIARITGMDPSMPWAGYQPPVTAADYLDDSDAATVVVLRTSKIGAEGPKSLREFTVSGGLQQRGCYAWYKPQFVIDICSHYRIHGYVVEALEDTKAFPACSCAPEQAADEGVTCYDCDQPVHFLQDDVPPGRYLLTTNIMPPYSLPLPGRGGPDVHHGKAEEGDNCLGGAPSRLQRVWRLSCDLFNALVNALVYLNTEIDEPLPVILNTTIVRSNRQINNLIKL